MNQGSLNTDGNITTATHDSKVKSYLKSIKGKTCVKDYAGYTFVFLSKYKQDFFIKM